MSEEKHRTTILIVDDDPALLQALPQVIYLRMTDVQVETVESATGAEQRIHEQDYDIIVSDIKMPGMDGIELLNRVKELRPDTPVLLITGHGDHGLATQALRGGAYDYILKPIDRYDFIAALQRAIQTRQLRRKVVEQQIALAMRAKSLEQLVQKRTNELVAANATKDKFLGIVSHELKMPLENLKGMAHALHQQLEQGEEVARVSRGLEDMEHALDRTGLLVQNLLNTALIDTNMFVLHRQRCDLVALCHRLIHEYTAGTSSVLSYEAIGQPIETEVDCDRIHQALINILTNARKYSEKGSSITITLQQSGYEAMLRVHDTGTGIPSEAIPAIFEQLYHTSEAEIQTDSRTGLGISIAHKIVERHGGQLGIESSPDSGNTFSIVLPCCVDLAEPSLETTVIEAQAQSTWTIIN